MSSKIAVRAQHLGKKFRLTNSRPHTNQFREDLMRFFKKAKAEEFWALQDLDLTIYEGESVALIGHNGSGKSTLLRLISRVLWPTTGFLEIYGRVGALLEVGTGFHGDLTGRENVYLSGAILGMKRSEVNQKFDEIVAFSEIEHFIDTPVKKYSSGMFLRLAFSVMAHLNSNILIIDEVISVGDMNFQQKCIDKIHSILKEGRTVIFVSHHIDKVREVCSRVVWLNKGRLIEDGSADEVIPKYEQANVLINS